MVIPETSSPRRVAPRYELLTLGDELLLGLTANGQPDENGDKAFDEEEMPKPEMGPLGGVHVVQL